ncbi:antibiotic biosynthesis monooxygenase [Halalkalibacillus sediminis]|uniref:Antibiotic biosynthesis monooxygenase n=1 Tax=Halalkalibacillus sediminis TaxID=2018042 RepID=A0A2I0QVD8_9BACI|nr:antibiotic biosynthesis monooxygenase [Halalkalibacillus sediminis]PKR78288.1 antibiotic biosynthesis monooxygenase [Halalkalibacillus sediminis]
MNKLWITHGTTDYLTSLKEKDNSIVVSEDEDKAVAFIEGESQEVFKEAHEYEVIDHEGSLSQEGFIVLNNIPVTQEGRPIFEDRFKNRAGKIEDTEGFQAIRILRPKNSNTYIVFTQWKDEASFKQWRESKAFDKAHQKSGPESKEKPSFIAGESYLTKLNVVK